MTFAEYKEKSDKPGWKFNLVVNSDIPNLRYIYPLKQKQVMDIVEAAKSDSYVEAITIFGSSITGRCTEQSDLDICIRWNIDCVDVDGVFVQETKPFMKAVRKITNYNCDIVHEQYLQDTLIEEAVKNGIVVYHRE